MNLQTVWVPPKNVASLRASSAEATAFKTESKCFKKKPVTRPTVDMMVMIASTCHQRNKVPIPRHFQLKEEMISLSLSVSSCGLCSFEPPQEHVKFFIQGRPGD